jgi:phage/plasmid primase-like uncharacterized protein
MRRIELAERGRDLGREARLHREHLDPECLDALADELGLTADSLVRLRVGWAGWGWTFPMCDAAGRIIGIRVRKRDGRKLAVRGSREGLFIPDGLLERRSGPLDRLLIAEGPTDTAALLDLGLHAVGRPSARSGLRLLTDLTRRLRPAEIVLVADHDEAGRRGADDAASVLAAYAPAVRVICPPRDVKDARAWVQQGATRDDVLEAIEVAQRRRLTVTARGRR